MRPFSWKFKHLEGAGNRRKPQIFAENRRKPQIGLCHLRCVTFSPALKYSRDARESGDSRGSPQRSMDSVDQCPQVRVYLFGTRVHQNRAILCGCGGDLHRSALLLNEVSGKRCETFATKFPKIAPKFAPNILVLSRQVEKSYPHISPDISHQRFQISNQISPKDSLWMRRRSLSGPVLRESPRDYLSDTPLLRAVGFLVSQHGQLGAIPPPPFLSVSPLESLRSGGAIPPPPTKGYLSDTCTIPYENKAKACDSPLCDTISRGYCAIWGGISHWAAKGDLYHPCKICDF